MITPLLKVEKLEAFYGQTKVLHGIDLLLHAGKITTILGANGAGKTTTLRALCQMMVSTKGAVTFDQKSLVGKPTEWIAAQGIAHVPDGRGTFLGLSVEENLHLGA